MKIALTFIIVIGFISIKCNGSALPSPVGATGISCTPHSAAASKHFLDPATCGSTCSTTDAENLLTAVSTYCVWFKENK